MEAEYSHLFLSSMQDLPLPSPSAEANPDTANARSTNEDMCPGVDMEAPLADDHCDESMLPEGTSSGWITSSSAETASLLQSYCDEGLLKQAEELGKGLLDESKWQVNSEEGTRNAQLRTSAGLSRTLLPKGLSKTTQVSARSDPGMGGRGAANRGTRSSPIVNRDNFQMTGSPTPATTSRAAVAVRTPSPCRSPSPYRGPVMQINLNDSYHEQLAHRGARQHRLDKESSFQELDSNETSDTQNPTSKPVVIESTWSAGRSSNGNSHPVMGQDGKALVEIMPADTESAVVGLIAAFGSVSMQEAHHSRSPDEAPRSHAATKVTPLPLPLITPVNPTISTPCLPQARRDGPPTFGSPCRTPSQGLDPIPDEGFRSMPMAVTVPEWRWCIPISTSESQCVYTLNHGSGNGNGNGVIDQGPCGNLHLPFGRSSSQAHMCGTLSMAAEDCSQLVVPAAPDWNCVARLRKAEAEQASQPPSAVGSRNLDQTMELVAQQVALTPGRRRAELIAPRTPPLLSHREILSSSATIEVVEQKPVVATTPRSGTPRGYDTWGVQAPTTPTNSSNIEAFRENMDLTLMGKMQGPSPALPVFPGSVQTPLELSSPRPIPSTPTQGSRMSSNSELVEGRENDVIVSRSESRGSRGGEQVKHSSEAPAMVEDGSKRKESISLSEPPVRSISVDSSLIPESPQNVGDKASLSSRESTDSNLPLEFSDIDEPPTMAVASGNERASFTDTNEIPMALPKMGKRRCVTQCFTSDGRRELSLGLRAMVTLDDVQHNH